MSKGNNWATTPTDAGGDVTAGSNITDNAIVRGDGGAKGIQQSGVLIDDSDNITAANSLTVTPASSGATPLAGTGQIFVENSGNTGVSIGSGTSGSGYLNFVDSASGFQGGLQYVHSSDDLYGYTAGGYVFKFNNAGSLQLQSYDVGALVSDASGNITASNAALMIETWGLHMPTASTAMNGNDYYSKIIPHETVTITKAQMYCLNVGGDPANCDAAIYNSAGTRIASMASTVQCSSQGLLEMTFDATVTLTKDTEYWVGVAADASTNTFHSTTSSVNDLTWNRFGGNTNAQSSLPAGTTTASRFCVRLV